MVEAARKGRWNAALPDRTAQRELKIEALYETAARAFTNKGFHGTSLDTIAAELGVSKAALYRYVPNKQALIHRLHQVSLDAAEAALATAEAAAADGLERVRLAVYHYLRALTASSIACLVLMEEGAMTGDLAIDILDRRRAFERRLRDLVNAGIADGSIVPCDAKLAVLTILGAVNWVSRWYRRDGSLSGHDIALGMSRQLARGIAAAPARFDADEEADHAA